MPELPEVETTRRGIAPHLINQVIEDVIVHQPRLRWPVPTSQLKLKLKHQSIQQVTRRAKYLLLHTATGTVIIHLGMSGSLRVIDAQSPRELHDHVELIFGQHQALRLRDPRRFGALLWVEQDPLLHPLLRDLGPEPLSDNFTGEYLYQRARRRELSVKALIMNSRIVAGIGNIYANEALFLAGIHPQRAAGRIALNRYRGLADCLKQVLQDAIEQGGTTLRDFAREDGSPGYFSLQLRIYGKAGSPCSNCGAPITLRTQHQRATYYCARCQH